MFCFLHFKIFFFHLLQGEKHLNADMPKLRMGKIEMTQY